MTRRLRGFLLLSIVAGLLLLAGAGGIAAQTEAPKKIVWQQLAFAIVKFNDDAPKSWNIYHAEKKGVLLVRLWKRYLLVDVNEEEVYDIDPEKVTVHGDTVEWSFANLPEKPIETPDWKERNVGTVVRVRFRLGKDGHFLELQLPLGPTGRPIY
ncbi:MAG: hypothetical protein WCE52_11075 [Candidatus Acidiferrum sp.]